MPAWIQGGGLIAFAAAIWVEQRRGAVALEKIADRLARIESQMDLPANAAEGK